MERLLRHLNTNFFILLSSLFAKKKLPCSTLQGMEFAKCSLSPWYPIICHQYCWLTQNPTQCLLEYVSLSHCTLMTNSNYELDLDTHTYGNPQHPALWVHLPPTRVERAWLPELDRTPPQLADGRRAVRMFHRVLDPSSTPWNCLMFLSVKLYIYSSWSGINPYDKVIKWCHDLVTLAWPGHQHVTISRDKSDFGRPQPWRSSWPWRRSWGRGWSAVLIITKEWSAPLALQKSCSQRACSEPLNKEIQKVTSGSWIVNSLKNGILEWPNPTLNLCPDQQSVH